jgi:tRNA (guanine-N7-)-methyltransferase
VVVGVEGGVPLTVGPSAPIHTFKRRGGRITGGQADARARLWPAYGVEVDVDGPVLDLESLFGRRAPVVLEIGFGMGEATAAMAAAQPEIDVLAVDVHTPGQGALLRLVEWEALTNVRVADGDALALLDHQLGDGSLAEVRAFFPDPWPKRRHWKRRLVGPRFAALVAQRLAPGGRLHVATDWPHYAEQVRRVLAASEVFDLDQPVPWRVQTRFEAQAVAAGRAVHDVVALRR